MWRKHNYQKLLIGCDFGQTWFLKRKNAVWIDMYIIFSAKATLQKAYAVNTGFLKSINWYAKVIFVIYKRFTNEFNTARNRF